MKQQEYNLERDAYRIDDATSTIKQVASRMSQIIIKQGEQLQNLLEEIEPLRELEKEKNKREDLKETGNEKN